MSTIKLKFRYLTLENVSLFYLLQSVPSESNLTYNSNSDLRQNNGAFLNETDDTGFHS